jgi:hypothetical protein
VQVSLDCARVCSNSTQTSGGMTVLTLVAFLVVLFNRRRLDRRRAGH